MEHKINYIVAVWLGDRRLKTVSDPEVFLHRHLSFLRDNKIAVDRVTIALAAETPEQVKKARDILRQYRPYYTELRLVVRDNYGLSYGGWNDIVNQCIENDEGFTHYFLLEDDYVPTHPEFLDLYLSKMTDGVGYVCQKLSHAALSGLFGTQVHAGISCGLLSGEAAEKAYEEYGTSLCIIPTENYDWYSVQMQVHFLDFISKSGYKITDTAKESSCHFVRVDIDNPRGWKLAEFADPTKPRYIEPIIEWEALGSAKN